ncbi:MAG: hypothetical protein MJ192_02635 [Clostridia bacterium]|nr:hypothetical protein [Clostridia bacterium]
MYAYTSNGSRTSLHLIVIAALSCAILLFSASSAEGVPMPWVFQLAGIFIGAFGVYMLTRYSLRSYRYEITDTDLVAADGQRVLDLTVTQATGRKLTVVCRVSLRDVTAVNVLDRASFRRQKAALCAGLTLFRYENTPFEPLSCYISVPEERSLLAIPADEGMARLLREAAEANAAPAGEAEE